MTPFQAENTKYHNIPGACLLTLVSRELRMLTNFENKCLRLGSCFSWFFLLSQPLFALCLFRKSHEKARVKRQAFIFKLAEVHSSLERSVIDYQSHL